MIGGSKQRTIFAGRFALLILRRNRRRVRFMSVGFLPGRGAGAHSTGASVECHMRVVDDYRFVHVDISDRGSTYARDCRVIEVRPVAPLAAVKSVSAVTVAVVDAAVESNLRAPVTRIPHVGAIVPTPVAGRPELANGSFHPRPGHPVIAVIVVPRPVAGGPQISGAGAERLLIDGQRWWADAN